MAYSIKRPVQFQARILIGILFLTTSCPVLAEDDFVNEDDMNSCQITCENYKSSSNYSSDSQLSSQCEAFEVTNKSKKIETALMAIDGAAAAACTLACGLSLGLAPANPTAAFATAACDRIATAVAMGDLVGQIALEGHMSADSALNLIMLMAGLNGMSSSKTEAASAVK